MVRDTGARFWIQRITVGGRVRELGHGSWPAVSLSQARRKAEAIRDTVAATGRLPEREPVAPASAPAARTLRDAVNGYVAAHAPSWRGAKTAGQFKSRLERHAAALLDCDPAAITLDDVKAALLPIWTGKPVLAGKVRSALEHALEWAAAAGWRPAGLNPASWRGALRTQLAKPSAVTRNRHHPALPWARVADFLAALRRQPGHGARCLEFVILTAARSGEARGAAWVEIDFAAACWRIPARRMKAGREHVVPLPAPALALLRRQRAAVAADEKLVFPSPSRRGGPALSDMALLAVIRRMDADGNSWVDERGERITPHGFRSSFRDWCGDTGQARELAEAALAHALGSATERAYARSGLLERRRALMDAWAAAAMPRSLRVVGDA